MIFLPTNGRTYAVDPRKTGIHATKWPLHAQWARPAGHGLYFSLEGDDAFFDDEIVDADVHGLT
jgi:hypothetical protein